MNAYKRTSLQVDNDQTTIHHYPRHGHPLLRLLPYYTPKCVIFTLTCACSVRNAHS